MARFLMLAIATVLWAGCDLTNTINVVQIAHEEEIGEAVIPIWTDRGSCSAVLVSPNTIITATHCLTDREHDYIQIAAELRVRVFEYSVIYRGETMIVGEKLDGVSVLRLSRPPTEFSFKVAAVSRADISSAAMAGFCYPGFRGNIKYSTQHVVNQQTGDGWLVTQPEPEHGCSGGGIFNDNGELAAIVLARGDSVTYSAHLNYENLPQHVLEEAQNE